MRLELVQKDKRGEVYKLIVDNQTYWLSQTTKGHARGGDIHDGNAFVLIIEGKCEIRLTYPEREEIKQFSAPMIIDIPADVPHLFLALENSFLLERYDQELPPYEKKRFYEPYRKLCR